MPNSFISYAEALDLTLSNLSTLPRKIVPLDQCLDHTAADDIFSLVDAPSTHVSLKDGFAVRSDDIAHASPDRPVRLNVLDTTAAGCANTSRVTAGHAVRIMSGATIPAGADAVVASEFTRDSETYVSVLGTAERGRNILARASDVESGDRIVERGERLTPGKIGLLAAAGYADVPVVPKPRVVLIATGTEIVPPGQPLSQGKVFASNVMTLNAWCIKFGMRTELVFVEDDASAIRDQLERAATQSDAVLTSGGAWTSRHDWISKVLQTLGCQKIFHHVRMGPGKAVGLGLMSSKPVFILPGGPPSNLLAFLKIALPGLAKMAGQKQPPLPSVETVLAKEVTGQSDWTQFLFGRLQPFDSTPEFLPEKHASRLRSMAQADAILTIAEGIARIAQGTCLRVQLLN
jgi:molybdopterin molybdotransferase